MITITTPLLHRFCTMTVPLLQAGTKPLVYKSLQRESHDCIRKECLLKEAETLEGVPTLFSRKFSFICCLYLYFLGQKRWKPLKHSAHKDLRQIAEAV